MTKLVPAPAQYVSIGGYAAIVEYARANGGKGSVRRRGLTGKIIPPTKGISVGCNSANVIKAGA